MKKVFNQAALALLLALCAACLSSGRAGGQENVVKPAAPVDTRFLRDYAETRGFMLGRPVKAKPTPDGLRCTT